MDKNQLKKIIIDQKEEIDSFLSRQSFIERDCFKKYVAYLESTQIKVIIGIRRCGKSVLACQLLKNKKFAYINFDDESLAGISTDNLNDVLETFYEIYGDFKYILFDEIQNIEGWELFVNRLQRKGFNIIITGSNSHLLSRELSTHLTGRHITLELFPFSFKEFLKYHNIQVDNIILSTKESAILKKKLEEFIFLGGFPEVVKDPINKKTYLNSLYSDMIHKDIIVRHSIKFSKTFKNIASSLMSNTASYVSFNRIKNIFNLKSTHTALNYLSFLEESFLFFLVPKFSYNLQDRVIASRKIYSIDTGMTEILGFNFSQNIGKIYENMVFLELKRKSIEHQFEISYWQDIYKNEVDFVIKQGKKVSCLIQVCFDISNYNTKEREISALVKSGKELNCKNLLVITGDYDTEEQSEGIMIKFIPLWKWLLQDSSF